MASRRLLTVLLLGFLSTTGAAAEDWPQFRGPGSQGVSSETGLPTTWSATTNMAWKAALAGTGTSSPIIVGDTVVATSQQGSYATASGADPKLARDESALAAQENAIGASKSPDGKLYLVVEAFHRVSGKRLWQHRTLATGDRPESHEKHNLATPTPVSDGKRIYAWFGNGQIIALDMQGKELWKRHLGQERGSFLNQWGHGSSPTLYKDLLILLCDHRPLSYLIALDAASGKERWLVDRGQGRVSHSTPVVVPGPRGDELIVNSNARIDAYNPTTGQLLWHAGSERQTPIPSPVHHEGNIYLSRGYRNSDILSLKTGGSGDVSGTHLRWRMPNGGSYVPSVVHYQGLIYITNEVGVVTCADAATGTPVWKERLGGIFFASPVAADGKIYLLSETGEMYVMRAGRKSEVMAKNEIGERFLASPAVSSKMIFLRGDSTLFAIAATK
ncbi:MAG TPA: PQQ-binding-like beta-propeller repeat protein [Bryobacteraceae bacterium]|nr:PQQ-binding-like beta-propeller repeat protein [Bryobacteraceae bacterium]